MIAPFGHRRRLAALALTLALAVPAASRAQSAFSSGSSGADGALRYTSAPSNRGQSAMAFDSDRGVAVLFGGGTLEGARFDDTWEWNGTRWTQASVAGPSARGSHALAYDSQARTTLLFGGGDAQGDLLDDTWTWDGLRWEQLTPPGERPGARASHGLAYDSDRNVVVLFGGVAQGTEFLSDTWEWNGTSWKKITTSIAPSPRAPYAIAYDRARHRTLLFGGEGADVGFKADTWEWDGETWEMKSPPHSPSGRRASAMAFDEQRGRVVLFGGTDSALALLGDTWEWTGSDWEDKTPPSGSPTPRRRLAVAYDSARHQTLLFGGLSPAALGDTWLWDGSTWTWQVEAQATPLFDIGRKADGVFNFTTIDVGPGVFVNFARNAANTPLTWLASGDVNIQGQLNLRGFEGGSNVDTGNEAPGGTGGFAGGLGGKRSSVSSTFTGTGGQGLGGGRPATTTATGGNAGFATAGVGTFGGQMYGSDLLQPLVGGSGGGGGGSSTSQDGGNGGGGGGAILIASSGKIRIDGVINVDGGRGRAAGSGTATAGGAGSGGSIRLVANRIEGGGSLSARNGNNSTTEGLGRIRTEAFVVGLTTPSNPANLAAPPLGVVLTNQGQIRIVSVDGNPVPQPPAGNTSVPDVVFNRSGTVFINVVTTNIPTGTAVTVRVASGATLNTASAPTDAGGNATIAVAVPAGVGTIQAFADYTPAN